MAIRILIAEDQEIFRSGLKVALANNPLFELVAEATNGEEAIQHTFMYQPDVVLMDINMPILGGYEASVAIKQQNAEVKIIALTINEDYDSLRKMNLAQVDAYLLKTTSSQELYKAIETVYNGNTYYCVNTQLRLKELMQGRVSVLSPEEISNQFSSRELQVLNGLCAHKHTKQIASELELSARTVEGIKARLQDKLGVSDSVGIVLQAVKFGLVKL